MSRDIFPKSSKSAVNRAGAKLALGQATNDDLDIIENWRAAHNYVLNTFQANLRKRAKRAGTRSPVQRLKRLDTIRNKLLRFPKMQFARMHDVVGCRVVFDSIDELHLFRNEFNKSRFAHKRRVKTLPDGTRVDAYNYIERPKQSGYRGIHDVFEYRAKQSSQGRASGGEKWNGLHIEIQYRTRSQHAWATAVEICDNFTENHGKFSDAPDEYLRYFALAGEILSRHFEPTSPQSLAQSNIEISSEFQDLESKHGMLQTLRGVRPHQDDIAPNKHMLLIFDDSSENTNVQTFGKFREAIEAYFELERTKDDNTDVVLVAADDADSVRFGFKNYFSDAREFVSSMDTATKSMLK